MGSATRFEISIQYSTVYKWKKKRRNLVFIYKYDFFIRFLWSYI